ncbi:hypothetical protein OIU77_026444 [Salix suchowensis]|uniref:Uncharacterized protein n=1 Tax=Salix suchowensis TaxID=1278906 RepID=A0ABQ9BLC2_9ROSI|nr:hypothetical protein OIU77_026444 [Salix suchowensis]
MSEHEEATRTRLDPVLAVNNFYGTIGVENFPCKNIECRSPSIGSKVGENPTKVYSVGVSSWKVNRIPHPVFRCYNHSVPFIAVNLTFHTELQFQKGNSVSPIFIHIVEDIDK